MARLEDLRPKVAVRGVLPGALVTVASVEWVGSDVVELILKDPAGKPFTELLYRSDEERLEIVERGRPWSFDGDGALLRLVSEAMRIRLAHLFDPVLAVHTSLVEPLPHQITAVYEAMLSRQLLRFLLADVCLAKTQSIIRNVDEVGQIVLSATAVKGFSPIGDGDRGLLESVILEFLRSGSDFGGKIKLASCSSNGLPGISMVDATDSWETHDLSLRLWWAIHLSTNRDIFGQS